jgi:cytochrome c oxidase subunit 1
LTGLFIGALAVDVILHDTYFVVAHFHYTMFGGVLVAFIGGIYYWWPKITGRMYNDLWGRIAALTVFVGFNMTFFPLFLLGTHGLPRRSFTYPEKFHTWQMIATIGAAILVTGLLLALSCLLYSLFKGRRAPANPWGAATLEWRCGSPPPHDNFPSPPTAGDPYDLTDLVYDAQLGGYIQKPS